MGDIVKSNKSVELRKNLTLPALPGSYTRLVYLTGSQKGNVYYLKGDRIILGRGNTADVLVPDMMSSREHAELKKLENGYVITDLGSENGTYVNDAKIVQHPLSINDKIIIGKTVFKYDITEVVPAATVERKKKEDRKTKGNRKSLVYLAGLFFILILFGGEEEKRAVKEEVAKPTTLFSNNFKNDLRDRSIAQKDDYVTSEIEAIMQRGKREYREQNYYRAISEFNMAIIMDPDNGDAAFFLRRASQALDNEIRLNLVKVQYDKSALKYNEAIVSYCTIIRLIQNFTDNDYYAKLRVSIAEELKQIEQILGMAEGEIKCFQESKETSPV